jgi:hypothetical protein
MNSPACAAKVNVRRRPIRIGRHFCLNRPPTPDVSGVKKSKMVLKLRPNSLYPSPNRFFRLTPYFHPSLWHNPQNFDTKITNIIYLINAKSRKSDPWRKLNYVPYNFGLRSFIDAI